MMKYVAVNAHCRGPYFDARERDYIVFQTGFDGWVIFLRLVSFQDYFFFISLHLLIITLFQEDNIFGTNATLTYGPQKQRHTCVW